MRSELGISKIRIFHFLYLHVCLTVWVFLSLIMYLCFSCFSVSVFVCLYLSLSVCIRFCLSVSVFVCLHASVFVSQYRSFSLSQVCIRMCFFTVLWIRIWLIRSFRVTGIRILYSQMTHVSIIFSLNKIVQNTVSSNSFLKFNSKCHNMFRIGIKIQKLFILLYVKTYLGRILIRL